MLEEQNVNSTAATAVQAIEYITNALTNGELKMKDACKELGWSFPRIRSRSLTIAKKLNCSFKKISRGVYILEPLDKVIDNTQIEAVDDSLIEGDGTEDDDTPLDPDEVEAALLGDNPPSFEV